MNDKHGRELGQALKAARLAAGWSQAQLAHKAGYARSTISTAESRGLGTTRELWERCDHLLGTALALTTRYDQTVAAALPGPDPADLAGRAWQGWPVTEQNGRLELGCGTTVDALQVPWAAGVLAASWWRHTGGTADPARNLPALSSPAAALVAIAAGDSWYFLAAPGSYPFGGPGALPGDPPSGRPGIRWHGPGSRIAFPPSRDAQGNPATWAFSPPTRSRLADPVALLALLGPAVAMTSNGSHAIQLPGGICVTPASHGPAQISPAH